MTDESIIASQIALAAQLGQVDGRLSAVEKQQAGLIQSLEQRFTAVECHVDTKIKEVVEALKTQTDELRPLIVNHAVSEALQVNRERRQTSLFDRVGIWSSVALIIGTLFTGVGLYFSYQATHIQPVHREDITTSSTTVSP